MSSSQTMSTSSGTNKLATERNQRIVLELVSVPGNDVCADCKTRNPRWASYNLGIFICVGCASVHRKIGTHVSKVKSLTLDSWTKEQVDRMKEMGNLKSNAIYNPNEVRHPPPPKLDDPARDNDLEQYIRSKYEYRRFIDRKALVASKLGPSRSASSVVPRTSTSQTQSVPKPTPPPESKTATDIAATMFSTAQPQLQPRMIPSQPALTTLHSAPPRSVSQPVLSQNIPKAATVKPEGVWADLISLQGPSANASLPLQYQAHPAYNGMPMNNSSPARLPNFGASPFGNMTASTMGLPANNASLNPFPQQSIAGNPFAQQSFSTQTSSPLYSNSAPMPSFQSNSPQIPSGFGQANTPFQQQVTSVPFYQPQPQPSTLTPPQSQPQFLSSSPNAQFLPSHSPQPQATTPNLSLQQNPALQSGFGSNNGLGMGGASYMTPSPQPMMNGMPGQAQMTMQPSGTFNSGFMQPQQAMAMGNNPFGQMQFTQGGGFPTQGPQWGPL
ncbi:ArfGap-domain-containing protein [Macrolepiota fuliginosa MF-IS2]|uniref:ArfGap-domain-containing protein n=1 Tax=Macrolepiota fuliginosa MF-IS2 TaxID=1400762 RepID=A0A9P5XKV4_9AGAR|nr:ArfGap-domain-containing protein [Macrolepiota fuliginosa MF-IS2]